MTLNSVCLFLVGEFTVSQVRVDPVCLGLVQFSQAQGACFHFPDSAAVLNVSRGCTHTGVSVFPLLQRGSKHGLPYAIHEL